MKNYLDLIHISAKVHKKQSRMTRICIVLAVLLVTTIFGMADMEMRCQKYQEIKSNGNWHVIFSGINENTAEMIDARPEIKVSGWYTYVNDKSDYTVSGKSVNVVGLNKNIFDNIFPTKITEGVYPNNNNEVALTENAKIGLGINIGDTITLKHSGLEPVHLTVVGFAESTSKLLKEDSYALLLTTDGFRSAIPQNLYTSQYIVQLSQHCNMQKVIADITEQYKLSDKQVTQNGNLLAVLGQSNNSYVLQLYGAAVVLFVVVLLAGVLMLAGSLNSNVMQRTEFFGMMRCLGATKKQIMKFVRREGLQWCKTSIPIGIILGIIIVWLLCALLRLLCPSFFAEMPVFGVSWISILFGIAVGILTVLLAARAPAKKAAGVSPLTAVSGNADSVKSAKKAANTFLFKVDTALGINHAVSSKKNFILMVGSFSLSIVLFLSFSAAVDFMHHAVQPLKPWAPDISIVSKDNTLSGNFEKQLKDNPKIKRVYGRMFANVPIKSNEQAKSVDLISYEDYQFSWAKNSLLKGSVDDVKQKDDRVLTVYDSNSTLNVGDTLTLKFGNTQKDVTVSGLLSSSPFDSINGVDTIICSENTFRKLTGKTDYTVVDIQLSKDATDDDVNSIRSMAGSDIQFSDRRGTNREAKGAYYSMMLFMYGFLVVIALITVFNIINSIAMSVSARMKQYGAMRAIGMSDYQLIRMVRAEAITYSAAGIVVGSILGLPLNKLLFESMITSYWGDSWPFPFGMLGLILAIVIITSIFAVHGPAKRIHNMSIVDTISAQ
jgi:putative ABC transport system permease protein